MVFSEAPARGGKEEIMTLTLTPLILGLGVQELVIILIIMLLLFGGSRLAGLGKSSGRALKEFKEETRGLREEPKAADPAAGGQPVIPPPVGNGQAPFPQQPADQAAYPPAAQPSPYNQAPQQPYQQPPQQPYTPAPQQPYTQAPQPYAQPPMGDPSAADARKDV